MHRIERRVFLVEVSSSSLCMIIRVRVYGWVYLWGLCVFVDEWAFLFVFVTGCEFDFISMIQSLSECLSISVCLKLFWLNLDELLGLSVSLWVLVRGDVPSMEILHVTVILMSYTLIPASTTSVSSHIDIWFISRTWRTIRFKVRD